jgi:hypothetical protein
VVGCGIMVGSHGVGNFVVGCEGVGLIRGEVSRGESQIRPPPYTAAATDTTTPFSLSCFLPPEPSGGVVVVGGGCRE